MNNKKITYFTIYFLLPTSINAYAEVKEDKLIVTATQPDNTVISGKQLDLIKGSTNSDIFSTVTAIQGNNSRNEAGAIDVGIRGLQGEGRVPIYVDGSLQSTHTNRGYQGVSDRTYIDSDLISNMEITKGIDSKNIKSGAIGGSVNIKTISVEDILKPGDSSGFLIKLRTSNNNVSPKQPEQAGNTRKLNSSPDLFDFHGGSATFAWGYKNDYIDTVFGYSKRKNGNYYSGRRGFSDYGTEDKINNQEVSVYQSEEVVNTSFESDSLLFKTNFHINPEQNLELIYRNHRQYAGEILAAKWFRNIENDAMLQWPLGKAEVNAYSSNYNYVPIDNSLINLNVGLWYTTAKMDQLNGLWRKGDTIESWRNPYSNNRFGAQINNSSELDTIPVTFRYGISSTTERIKPDDGAENYWSEKVTSRDGRREEQSIFLNTDIDLYPVELSLGANYHNSKTKDFQSDREHEVIKYNPKLDLSSLIKYNFNDSFYVFMKSSQAYRMPSLYETTVSNEVFSYDPNFPISPEKSIQNEFGFNLNTSALLDDTDNLNLNASYFINNTKDYISPGVISASNPKTYSSVTYTFTNYDNLKLSGIDLTANYKGDLFYSTASLTYYTQREICSNEQAIASNSPKCNSLGFAWGLTPTRIPPRTNISILLGKKFFNNDLDLGVHYRYYSGKENPAGWMKGTAASPITEIEEANLFDVYAKYQITPDISIFTTVNNLTNEYYIQPGSVISIPDPGRTITLGTDIRF